MNHNRAKYFTVPHEMICDRNKRGGGGGGGGSLIGIGLHFYLCVCQERSTKVPRANTSIALPFWSVNIRELPIKELYTACIYMELHVQTCIYPRHNNFQKWQ